MPYRRQHNEPMSVVDQLLAVLLAVFLSIIIGGLFLLLYFG